MSTEAAVLRVEALDKSYPMGSGWTRARKQVLHHVSLQIAPGEVLALVGESGSGKSTVARIVSRLEPADAGIVELNGLDVLKAEPRRASLSYRGQVQMIFQDPFGSLNPVHTIRHHLARPLLLHRRATPSTVRAHAAKLLEDVGLTPAETYLDRHPHELSGGQRQRVAIARALAVEPKVIVADEPTSMLDVATRLGVLELLRRLAAERQIGVLLITHDLASARALAHRIIVMYAGRIVESGATEAVLSAPAHPYTRSLIAALPNGDGSFRSAVVQIQPAAEPAKGGCPFAPRCPHVMTRCHTVAPSANQVEDGHQAWCHLFEHPQVNGESVE